jgi:hypothetical protein
MGEGAGVWVEPIVFFLYWYFLVNKLYSNYCMYFPNKIHMM